MVDYGSNNGRQMREVVDREQLEQYLTWARQRLDTGYAEFERWFTREMQDFSQFEATWQVASIQAAANGRVMPDITSGNVGDIDEVPEPTPRGVAVALATSVPAAQDLWVAVSTRPFQGATLEEYFNRLDVDSKARYEQAIRQSWVENWTLQQTMQSLRGTSTANYRDGVTGQSRREIEMFTRTATNHVSETARQVTYQQNFEVIKGWMFEATLDGRTSAECRTLDSLQKVYPIGEGPSPPRHPNCRSVTRPVLKSWRELGFNIREPEAATRGTFAPQGAGLTGRMSSAQVTRHLEREGYSPAEIRDIKQRFSGQVPESVRYEDFLRRQSKGFQEDVLGKAKAKLFREGKLPVTKFTNDMGRERTLPELKKLYPEAWEAAGLPA